MSGGSGRHIPRSDAGAHYSPIRHHLAITAFGVTAWAAQTAGDVVINDHDEDDPAADQELFLVLRGHAVFDLDGGRVDAPAGTLVYASPGARRSAYATKADTTILAIEGTPGAAYTAHGWELQYPMLFFSFASCESQCGRTADALAHLARAVGMSEEFRDSARTTPIWIRFASGRLVRSKRCRP